MAASQQTEPRTPTMPMQPGKWKMPYVEPGMIVFWHPDQHGDGIPAIVVVVGGDTISVNVAQMDTINFQCRTGCRHVSDPRNVRQDDRDSGFWSHTKFTDGLLSILRELQTEREQPKPAA